MAKNPIVLPQTGVAEQQTTDLSAEDLEKIKEFQDAGLPGIAAIDQDKLYQMMELYLSGSTYWQISSTLQVKRVAVTYLSHRYDWYIAKQEYLQELSEHLKARIISSKIVSQDFLLQLQQMWQKKIGSKIKRYLATDDPSHADEIDLKEVGQYLKTIEMINNMSADKIGKGNSPAVGLNLGDGVTIERNGDNKLTITPKEKTIGEMLKAMADSRRVDEQKNDIPDTKNDNGESTNEES